MADLNTDVRYIKGIGEQRAKALGKLGIATLRDLISYFPRAYDDRSALRRIADLVPGETAGVAAMVAGFWPQSGPAAVRRRFFQW